MTKQEVQKLVEEFKQKLKDNGLKFLLCLSYVEYSLGDKINGEEVVNEELIHLSNTENFKNEDVIICLNEFTRLTNNIIEESMIKKGEKTENTVKKEEENKE